MKLLLITNTGISELFFNKSDTDLIISHCKNAKKQWSDDLVGFFINTTISDNYIAISVKDKDGTIESMEYVDIETSKPEFSVTDELIKLFSTKEDHAEISFNEFEPVLDKILTASVKARKWEVYPEINKRFATMHS